MGSGFDYQGNFIYPCEIVNRVSQICFTVSETVNNGFLILSHNNLNISLDAALHFSMNPMIPFIILLKKQFPCLIEF